MKIDKIIFGTLGLLSFVASFILIDDKKIWLGIWLFIYANNLGLMMQNKI